MTNFSHRVRRTSATAALGLTLALSLVSAPGRADVDVHRDAARDVYAASLDFDTGTLVEGIDPTIKAADLRRVAVRHDRYQLRVIANVRDLRARDDLVMQTAVRASDHSEYLLTLVRAPFWGSVVMLTDLQTEDEMTCGGARGTFSARRDRLTIRVPRSCLDRPRWVRAAVGAMSLDIEEGDTPEDFRLSIVQDDARLDGEIGMIAGPGSGRSFTPRLWRG